MADCPSDADLAGFLNESLPPDRVAGLSTHVDGCTACQERLDRLTHESEGAVARYKELSSANFPVTGPTSSPEANTLVGEKVSLPTASRLTGLPSVPGFDMVEEIGRGGMGVVYKARHRRLNRLCALKMILAGGAADARTVQRFLFEAEILARVQHTQVVQVFEVDTYQGPTGVPVPYLAMELLEGGSLSKRIKEGAFAPRDAAELIEGIARAVHTAHLQGVIHRDLKPGNILFLEPGDRSQETIQTAGDRKQDTVKAKKPGSSLFPVSGIHSPKVTDFGLAKFIEAGADLTGSGQVVGTPHYMAPEQAAGSKQIGPPADVYALGAILFECLTGRPPFVGGEPLSVLLKVVNDPPPDVRSLRPEVSRALAAIVMRCLDKDPRRRYASAEEFADDLRRFLDNRPTVARPLRRRERLWLLIKRNPVVSGLLLALAVVLVVAFIVITFLWMKAEHTAEQERDARTTARRNEVNAIKAAEEATTEREAALKAEERAKQSLAEAKAQKLNADHRQAELEFGRAMTSCEEGRVEEGLQSFVRAIELAESTKDPELARVARINLAAWPRELPPPGRAYPHTKQPRLAAFHPDGKHMVTAGVGNELYLWDTTNGQKVRTYKPPPTLRPSLLGEKAYWSVAVSRDGKRIATGDSHGSITIWNTDSPNSLASFPAGGPDDMGWSVGFAPDGTLWAADGQAGVKHWDLSKLPKATVLTHLKPRLGSIINVIVVSDDGKRVYTADRSGLVHEWNTETGLEGNTWQMKGWAQDLAVSPDGAYLGATGPGGLATVIDLKGTRPPLEVSLAGAYGNGIAFAPKHPFLVTADGDGSVRFWHRETGQPIGIPMRFTGEVTRPRFRPDSDDFAIPAGDSVYLCRVPDPPGVLISPGHGIRVRGLDISPNGERLAVADDAWFEVFNPLTRKQLQSVLEPGHAALSLRFDPNPTRSRVFRGHRLGFDQIAVPDGKLAGPSTGPLIGRVYRIEFLDGGTSVIALGTSLIARYDVATTEQLAVAKPAEDIPSGTELYVMALRPDERELLVAFNKRIVFLDPKTLEANRPGWTAGNGILDARYTPDGTKILIGRKDNAAELLDAKTGASLIRSMPHTRGVTAVAVSPDGKILLTGCRDGTARFWDATSGLPLGAPLRHMGPVTHVLYAPDGKHVATATDTGHVMLWDVPPPAVTGSLDELREKVKQK
jgi:serine/threonine protein kinase/WD40 repeat protein